MSTIPEAMIANALGLQVGAVSCISNLAAGRSANPLNHEEVEQTAQNVLPQMTKLFANLYQQSQNKRPIRSGRCLFHWGQRKSPEQ